MASLEELSEKIYNPNTKKYFEEVLSSYYNKNYRAAIVMLWSTLVYDLKLKLRDAHDIYGNEQAGRILKKIEDEQKKNPKSSAWELTTLKEIKGEKSLINETEYEKLARIQQDRHLAAHPIIQDDVLITPNPSLVRGYIEYALEHVLTKPPIHIGNITKLLLENLPSENKVFSDHIDFKKFITERYLKNIHESGRLDLFKTFWKFTFSNTGDEEHKKNSVVYFHLLEALTEYHEEAIIKLMKENKEEFVNKISLKESEIGKIEPLIFLITFFSKFSNIFNEIIKLEDPIVGAMKESRKNSIIVSGYKYFLYDASEKEEYLKALKFALQKDTTTLKKRSIEDILLNNPFITLNELLNEFSDNYGTSMSYGAANARFANQIRPLMSLYNENTIKVLLKVHSENSQCYGRHDLDHEYPDNDAFILYNRALDLLGEDYDFSDYPNYHSQIERYRENLIKDTEEEKTKNKGTESLLD